MKRLKYLFAALLLAVLAACAAPLPADAPAADGMVRISVGLQFPETTTASTRTWADVPDYGNLDLYLILFEDNGNPAANYLTQVVKAEHNPAGVTTNGVEINFKAELRAQDKPVIHFIAIEKEQPLDIEWGPENVVIPRLTTSGGHDAYWQRVPLGMALSEENREAVNEKLRPVTMVRNFAKINVRTAAATSTNNLNYFELEGFCVVNQFDRGTIAPYSERGGFASFLNGRTTRSYAAMKDAGYTGTRPAGAQLIHTEIPAPDNFTSTDESIYLYERAFTATNHTYLILKAKLLPGAQVATTPSGKSTYYKLDLGTQNTKGFFEYYNLLRNFEYTITITGVGAEGYDTPEEAAHGVAFNNLTASVDTRELTKITDGQEMIYVNFISMVLVSDDPIDLCYCYLRGFDRTATCISDEVIWEDEEVGVREGDVIDSWVKTADVTEANPGGTIPGDKPWSRIILTPKTPSDVLVSQEVMLYKPYGLSRIVTLYLRNPWKLIDTEVYSKYDNNEFSDSTRPEEAAAKNPVGSAVGAPVILCFDLPDDLPKAMFPLEFLIESNRQNIENDQLGSKAVTSSPSLFDYTDQHSIQYVKTVTWEYYCPNGDPDDKENLNRLVVCNFKTITDTSLSEITGGETTLRIKNQYFELEDVVFERR